MYNWHIPSLCSYYMNGRTATLSDFIDPDILDYFPQQVDEVKAAVREAGMPHAELWLGETSTAWGGGAVGLSNAYVAGFMWVVVCPLHYGMGWEIKKILWGLWGTEILIVFAASCFSCILICIIVRSKCISSQGPKFIFDHWCVPYKLAVYMYVKQIHGINCYCWSGDIVLQNIPLYV